MMSKKANDTFESMFLYGSTRFAMTELEIMRTELIHIVHALHIMTLYLPKRTLANHPIIDPTTSMHSNYDPSLLSQAIDHGVNRHECAEHCILPDKYQNGSLVPYKTWTIPWFEEVFVSNDVQTRWT